jgi:F0F1-type ATP synthase membrane subunit a
LFFCANDEKLFVSIISQGYITLWILENPLYDSWIRNKQKRIDFFIFVFVCVWLTSSWGYSRGSGVHDPSEVLESWMVLNQTQMKNTKKEKNFKTFFVFCFFLFLFVFHSRAPEGTRGIRGFMNPVRFLSPEWSWIKHKWKTQKKKKILKLFLFFVSFCFCLYFIHELLRVLEGSGGSWTPWGSWVLNGLESDTNEKHKKILKLFLFLFLFVCVSFTSSWGYSRDQELEGSGVY